MKPMSEIVVSFLSHCDNSSHVIKTCHQVVVVVVVFVVVVFDDCKGYKQSNLTGSS